MNESNLRELRNLEKDKIASNALIEKQKEAFARELLNSNIKESLSKKEKLNFFERIIKKLSRVCS